jgi:hypothetical protein
MNWAKTGTLAWSNQENQVVRCGVSSTRREALFSAVVVCREGQASDFTDPKTLNP